MEKILPIQSVDKKIKRQMSVLVGNYEFYYTCGAFKALFGLPLEKTVDPIELKKNVLDLIHEKSLKIVEPDPEKMCLDSEDLEIRKGYIVYLLERYEITDKFDEVMLELFDEGYDNWSL